MEIKLKKKVEISLTIWQKSRTLHLMAKNLKFDDREKRLTESGVGREVQVVMGRMVGDSDHHRRHVVVSGGAAVIRRSRRFASLHEHSAGTHSDSMKRSQFSGDVVLNRWKLESQI